jgi:hypothetical protein
MAISSKEERFTQFLQRLMAAPPASSGQEAFVLLGNTLNEVEDELADIPYQPGSRGTDGRMYPPQEDSARDVPGRSDVVRYRSRGHDTYIRDNGAIEIRDLAGNVVLSKPGSNGLDLELRND